MRRQGQLKTLFVVIGFLIAISITACGDDNGPGPDKSPILSISNDTLDFGQISTSKVFTISNSGDADLSWSITSGTSSWIDSYSPDSGTILADSSEVTLTIDRTGLASGTYSAEIYITSNGGDDTVFVTMAVPVVEIPVLSPSTNTIDFGAINTIGTFIISNSGNIDLSWSITSDNSSWLVSISPESGTILTDSSEVTITIDRIGLASGAYSAEIYISSNGGDDTIFVTMEVPTVQELVLTLPQISTTECQSIEAPITVINFTDIGGAQLGIEYDTLRITYDSVISDYLNGAMINASSGIVHIVWADITGSNPVTIADGETLATIHFTDLSGISQLTFTGHNSIGDASGETVQVIFNDGYVECTAK